MTAANGRFRDAGTRPDRRTEVIELAVFLFLIVPSMVLSFFIGGGDSAGAGFLTVASVTIVRDLALVSLVLYFVWRSGELFGAIGWTERAWPREMALGAALFVPMFIAAGLLEATLVRIGLTAPTTVPSFLTGHGAGDVALAIILVIVVAISEETIFRGYLIRRFGAATGSIAAAVVLSAFIFSLGHGYEGSAGVVTVGFLGLVLGGVYVWRGSLVAPIVMHFLQDFIGIVVPMLTKSS